MAATTMKMGQSQFGVPAGTPATRGKFLGIETRDPQPGSSFGPGAEWRFEIIEGPFTGRIVSRTTAQAPTLRNSCGRFLVALTGGDVPAGAEIDWATFVGQVYLLGFELNQAGTGTRVASIAKIGNSSSPSAAPAGVNGTAARDAPATPPTPPPRPNRRANTPATVNPAEQFWSCLTDKDSEEPVLRDRKTLQDHLAIHHISPNDFLVCPVNSQTWEPAAKFAFSDGVPF
jgi:hypothetical protein